MLDHTTAVLIFTRSLQEERRKKPFLAKGGLLRTLYRHTLKVAEASGLTLLVYDESMQNGDDFGQRFANSLQSIFDQGFQRIIAIGNDCPQLSTAHIQQAQRALDDHDAVIGGTSDGGFYLMGIHKNGFDRSDFLRFNWNNDTLYYEIVQYMSDQGHLCRALRKLHDVDSEEDLKNLPLHKVKDIILRRCIASILHSFSRPVIFDYSEKAHWVSQVIFNKGSPSLIAV